MTPEDRQKIATMRDEWIIDMLTDLRGFAHVNGLPLLAAQLDDTVRVAVRELAQRSRADDRYDADDTAASTASGRQA
ncbi:MAG: hypothetical protein WCD16_06920 [Paracoccaceae bacterium]